MNESPFELNKHYIINATGFPEPIEGEVTEIDIDATGNVILGITTETGTLVNVYVSAITGWTSKIDEAA